MLQSKTHVSACSGCDHVIVGSSVSNLSLSRGCIAVGCVAVPARHMIRTLLIANRGEIACRIARTARRMGIESIAVFSEADANALHVRTAERAVPIGPAPARYSYLNIPRIIEAATAAGADAIHPGYGFLSENPTFAEACADAGIIFVGPPADAMR